MYTIENEYWQINFSTRGAEMQSLWSKTLNRNVLWSGDEAFWGGKAPILFPIVGSLKNGEYHYEGTTYRMPRHGFARRMDFSVISHESDQIVFELCDTEETLKQYPFHFKLTISYTLEGDDLITAYDVYNNNDKDMYYSVGAHPAYHFDYQQDEVGLCLDRPMIMNSIKLNTETGLITDDHFDVFLGEESVIVEDKLFDYDTVILKEEMLDTVQLVNFTKNFGIEMRFPHFDYFGIWSPKAPFVCLEPWCGVADAENHSGDLKTKIGIKKLRPHKSHKVLFAVNAFELEVLE